MNQGQSEPGGAENGRAVAQSISSTANRGDAGTIRLNFAQVSDAAASFGATRQIGPDREDLHLGMIEYVETKHIAVQR